MFEFYTVRELYDLNNSKSELEKNQIEYVEVDGWVKSNRDSGAVGFIVLNDGSCFSNVQVVYNNTLSNHPEVSKILTGTSIKVCGKFCLTPNNKQPFKIQTIYRQLFRSLATTSVTCAHLGI